MLYLKNRTNIGIQINHSPSFHFGEFHQSRNFKNVTDKKEISMDLKYSVILFFVGTIPFWKEAKASMPMDCMPEIVEVRIYFGNGKPNEPSINSKSSVFNNLAVKTRDTAKINYLRSEKWYLSRSEAHLRNYKFAIISIPDSIQCPQSKPDTTYFDSECKYYENSINRAEIDPKLLGKISRLVPAKQEKLIFDSRDCKEKMNKSP